MLPAVRAVAAPATATAMNTIGEMMPAVALATAPTAHVPTMATSQTTEIAVARNEKSPRISSSGTATANTKTDARAAEIYRRSLCFEPSLRSSPATMPSRNYRGPLGRVSARASCVLPSWRFGGRFFWRCGVPLFLLLA